LIVVDIKQPSAAVPTLFSASQPNAGVFFDQQQFEWSLHYNLLFHPAGLVSPDPFFFSPFLHDYLASQPEGRTWYENALVEGLIIPFVRDQSVGGFYDLWKLMSASNLQGHYEKAKGVARRLDALKGRATPDHWKPWPAGMGKKFANLVEGRLSRDLESMIPLNLRGQDADNCTEYLRRTKPFRVDDIEAAKRSRSVEDGLRVSEILWASGRRILGAGVNIKHIEELLSKMAASSQSSPQDVEDARQFYKTMIELYNENLSNSFEITKNVTDFDVMSRMFSAEGTRDLQLDDALTRKAIFHDIDLPPLSLLKTFSFDRFLIAARTSREFGEYQHALAQWMKNSKDDTLSRNVTEAVNAYVGKIHQLCGQRPINWDQYRVTAGHTPSVLRLATKMLAFGAGVTGAYLVHEQIEPIVGSAMAFASVAGGHVAAKAIDRGFDIAEHMGNRWLYIHKIKKQKATFLTRDDATIEVHDQTKQPSITRPVATLDRKRA
jgi:hypothetical protein